MAEQFNSNSVSGLLPNRACQNCVRVKVKCVPQEGFGDLICQRCRRLKKTCSTAAPAIRKRRRTNESKVALLENRINELSALVGSANSTVMNSIHTLTQDSSLHRFTNVQTSGDQHGSSILRPRAVHASSEGSQSRNIESRPNSDYAPVSPLTTDDQLSTLLTEGGDPDVFEQYPASSTVAEDHSDISSQAPLRMIPAAMGVSVCLTSPKPADFCPIFLDPKLEATLFEDFCTNMSPFFPFVVLDASVSASVMKRKRPFLFWACLTAASHHQHQLHRRLSEEMLKGIGEHALAKSTKSLDLLQAILVMTAWYHFHAHLAPQLTNLLYLANALIVDLGLNRLSPIKKVTETTESSHGHCVDQMRISDECRALLGCFFLMSKSSMCCTCLDPMRYTKHMDECCHFLKQAAEFESDTNLLQLVNIHRITGKYIRDEYAATSVPMQVYSTMFLDELQRFQLELPPGLNNSPIFRAEITHCKVYLHEPSQLTNRNNSTELLLSLHSCLTGLEECVQNLDEISAEDLSHATFTSWVSIMHCLIVHARLCFLKVDGWDLKYVRSKLNFVSVVQKITDKFEAIREYNKTAKPDTAAWKFSLYVEKLRKCKYWYETKIAAEERMSVALNSDFDTSAALPDTFNASFFDPYGSFDDATLWGDILGDWTQF